MDLEWLWLIIPCAYISISTFFFCFPTILCKKYRYKYQPFNDLVDSSQAFCIGHRGGGFEGPENTVELFEKNHNIVHMFELDVCLTKDGKLVVHHDARLTRTCGSDIQISSCDYADLPPMLPEYQSFGGPMMKTHRNKIPLLEEMFEKFPEKPMNIELKTASPESIAEFDRLVRKYGREHITVWGVLGDLNQQLRQTNPETVNFYSAKETLGIYILFLFGLLPFACIRQGVLDIPLVTKDFTRIVSNFSGNCCTRCLIFFALMVLRCFNCLSWLFIRHLKKRGILTFYFILNSEQDYENALSKGCSGIMTDRCEHLREYLKREGVYYGMFEGDY